MTTIRRRSCLPQQPSAFDFYRLTVSPLPEEAKDGDRLFFLNGKPGQQILVHFDGEWYGEPDASQEIETKLEAIRSEIAEHLTPAADAVLDKL